MLLLSSRKPGHSAPVFCWVGASAITTTLSTSTSQAPGGGTSPTPTTLQEGWYWIRAVATPNYRSYLQAAQPTALAAAATAAAVISSPSSAGQFKLEAGQLVYNRFGSAPDLYMHVEGPAERPHTAETAHVVRGEPERGDTLTWAVADIPRSNTAAWLVCGDSKDLFVNMGEYSAVSYLSFGHNTRLWFVINNILLS
ncbi:hypothetical protein MMYC01_208126 [Madurella mycetomatis]|uniref:Uncharacterized protein n=1 Tax=Madurella mycetomatis TaxID=100816 RepID=A0A175VW44_9PEZI|nr:hypothetical protein MMYC01_208126 [Madurella mycetomatis]